MLTLLTLLACEAPPCSDSDGRSLRVDWLSWENPEPGFYPTIGAALARANPGTTICVSPGTWREALVIETPGVTLAGAGSGQTLLTVIGSEEENQQPQTVLTLSSTDLVIRDLAVEGGDVGIQVSPHSEVKLTRVTLRNNGIGLSADDPLQITGSELLLEGNEETGALLTGEGPLPVSLSQLTVRDNGDAALSEAGGIISSLPLRLVDATFRRNAGTRATELSAQGGLDAEGLDVLGSPAAGGPPRLSIGDTLRLSGATIETRGSSALTVNCGGRDAWIENLAIVAASGPWPSESLVLTDCSGQLAHATLAHVDGGESEIGLVLQGYGDLAVSNSVIVGYDIPLTTRTWWGDLRPEALFTGTIEQAGLLHVSAYGADLRPLVDSPLVDAGITLDVPVDRLGQPRPQGAAPDVGAYERR